MKKLITLLAFHLVSAYVPLQAQVNIQDSLALVDLYNSTNGANWTRNTNWKTNNPVNTWSGVTVQDKRVVDLRLVSINLSGQLPTSIANLTELNVLSLSYNNLTGVIPTEIGNLKKLIGLELHRNQLTGTIPREIGEIAELVYLDLSFNELTGNIPVELASLPNLTSCDLHENNLSGELSRGLDALKSTTAMYIRANRFNFDGLEYLAPKINVSLFFYGQQRIPINFNSGKLSLNAGGTLANNTYTWYKNGVFGPIAVITGDSTYTPLESGQYTVDVENKLLYQQTLRGEYLTILIPDGIFRNIKAGNWSDPSVWNNQQVPSAGSTVVVKYDLRVDIDATCKKLTIESGKISLAQGKGLVVKDH